MDGFGALADPTRRRILLLLGKGEQTAGDIARRFDASAPAISQHLKVLRDARLVRARTRAQHRIYSLDPKGWAEIDAWYTKLRGFWSARLDALADRLGTADGTADKTTTKRRKKR